ncbi:ADP-ribosylglycohydrolase family protein [Cyclobacterium amurskyense]|uniref:ADP-ribosylglycohydrolase family protein n=1 Tax=Cyclobacterium amurskyense TaxID=320787 RepID=UPI0030D976AF|tara:strand:- start:1582 stop:2853 length:1272 start_codon:yes stop_codon:yes gene_type:complete
MRNFNFCIYVFIGCCLWACEGGKQDNTNKADLPVSELSKSELSDKVKGLIVGSAIGDAMGAPTEMWAREDIQKTYGWVTGLDTMVREVSPEGIWKANLPAGGTTDDTRWKALIVDFMSEQNSLSLDVDAFSNHIIQTYEAYFNRYKSLKPDQTKDLEETNLKVLWLQEWYKVSLAIKENKLKPYQKAMGKFYGGEMVCAGLLYAPALGLLYPSDPEMAYNQAYNLSIYDLGLAKDISALSAAMTSAALTANGNQNEVLRVLKDIDPEGYFSSRLVGRSSYRVYELALDIVAEAKDSLGTDLKPNKTTLIPESSILRAYQLLDQNLQDMPFHAAEIHLHVLTAMLFNDFKFKETMIFLVNYGRDNDTTAAIAGAILGAYHGYAQLPIEMREQVEKVNDELLDINLEKLAEKQINNTLSLYLWPD